jgi:hypothetical protein
MCSTHDIVEGEGGKKLLVDAVPPDTFCGRLRFKPGGGYDVLYEMSGFKNHEEFLAREKIVWGDKDPSDAIYIKQ